MEISYEEGAGKDEIVLHFELAPGQFADTKIVAEALIRWAELVEAAVKAIEPAGTVELEIIGNERGSLRFPQIIKFIEQGIADVDAAWQQYPYIRKAVIGSAHVLATGVVGGLIAASLAPEVQKVELTEGGQAAKSEMEAKISESTSVQTASRKFYQIVERDPAITGVGVAQSREEEPVIVPRSEFHARSGLWSIEEDPAPAHEKIDEWDVVLLRAPFSHKRLPWQFSRDGLTFSALMDDAQFLLAVKEGRVPINLQEGVVMRIRLAYSERLEGQVWKTEPKSRRVVKVISPTPLPPKP
ncbi:hypothetical protein SLG_06610 [Sphingobium sp. SYK-6]|uniref:hypothetical protein n=1 Tax=Sphingobium sp. (strain NBRC 103272 / SYK-6) TaxID=627192 RepID=UPI0002276910|nr:hypothetical protein [Sphingobium sp. SYK-6]BAK65336.1 hypothetical protein SLG_06610 [Sphingobium sp. SYK-6]